MAFYWKCEVLNRIYVFNNVIKVIISLSVLYFRHSECCNDYKFIFRIVRKKESRHKKSNLSNFLMRRWPTIWLWPLQKWKNWNKDLINLNWTSHNVFNAKNMFGKYVQSLKISAKICKILLVWFDRVILSTSCDSVHVF